MRRSVRTVGTLVGALATTLALLLVTACVPARSTTSLTYVESGMFNSLYPPLAGYYPNGGVLNNIADRLLWQDPQTLELHPWVAAELPEINEQATEFTFRLRPGITYSDGSALDAHNVVKNYTLYAQGDPARKLAPSEQLSGFLSAEAVDDLTVRFRFDSPAPDFPQATSTMNQALLSSDTLDLDSTGFGPGNATAISGSGPFSVEEEELGTDLVLRAREDYAWAPPARADHQGPAEIERVHITLAAEDSVRTGALTSGQAEIIRQVEAPDERHLHARGLEVYSAPTNGVNNAFYFHFRHPLLSDRRVRQALIHGIDRSLILRTLFSDSYPEATSPLAASAQGYRDQSEHYVYDPELSRRLLDEAGWVPGEDGIRVKDGQRLSLTFNEAVPQPRSKQLVTKAQEMLRDLGVEIHLHPGDRAAQQAAMKDQDVVQVRHSMVGRASLDVLPNWVDGAGRNSLLNTAGGTDDAPVGDPVLQARVEEFSTLVDPAARERAVGDVQDYLSEQAYVLPLFEEPQVYGLNPRVMGFSTEAIGRPSFYAVSLADVAVGKAGKAGLEAGTEADTGEATKAGPAATPKEEQ
ncbi:MULTISPECIES: TIGR04028 family ABC transporter substrate-binding protein [unclassified Corynebacterium]|uniref:TIGR04028 family ABC transporter substrate-binding protein n=1 Tax=unclassified Corynebacterium TaxID=2624378 RepID=UPI0029C9E0DD|nr:MULTISPECIES: TIGR04028 family ABC transporter substrate-binding protein [unclassified Corynebacterium]WPF65637.1 TIGR04028 family ABC transporter substrate-binding protein [Corynebacterium sp. 22KM0430]WPF68132.1 TIGR04028 family ABC transporter substrate-binding protein [Corynebacterium sp. 21KM1197]